MSCCTCAVSHAILSVRDSSGPVATRSLANAQAVCTGLVERNSEHRLVNMLHDSDLRSPEEDFTHSLFYLQATGTDVTLSFDSTPVQSCVAFSSSYVVANFAVASTHRTESAVRRLKICAMRIAPSGETNYYRHGAKERPSWWAELLARSFKQLTVFWVAMNVIMTLFMRNLHELARVTDIVASSPACGLHQLLQLSAEHACFSCVDDVFTSLLCCSFICIGNRIDLSHLLAGNEFWQSDAMTFSLPFS